MFSMLRRSLAFRRKVHRAGLRIVGTGQLPPEAIRWHREDDPASVTFTVHFSPHLSLLHRYQEWGENLWPVFQRTAYYRWHRSLRGFQHPRPDDWIEAMGRRLVNLYLDIQRNGYRCQSVADRIAVLEDGRLWDGGHRLACLTALGWAEVPVVKLERRP